jgi:glycosyltransferase involved in cell wall biosynthesis
MDVIGQGFLKTIFKFHNQFILPQIVKKADKIILTSLDYGKNSNLARWLGNYPAKFLEVPNGVDSQKFQPQPKNLALLGQYGIDPKDKIVLFVGGLDQAHYFKGVPYLIEAMDRLQQANYQWQLMIVGEGELKKDYFDFANQLGVGHKTIFAGYVADNDLPSYYNLADVCVLPSIDQSEAFGLTLLEAMACAKPVVATNLAGVRTVVDDGLDGLLVQPKNANDLAAKINYLLTNFNIAQQFGKNGRRKIEQNYEWGMIGKKLDAVYLSLY